jgi:hypothetical protein
MATLVARRLILRQWPKWDLAALLPKLVPIQENCITRKALPRLLVPLLLALPLRLLLVPLRVQPLVLLLE